MRLLVRLVQPAARNRFDDVTFECVVVRLIGPVRRARGVPAFIHADVELPDKYRDRAAASVRNPDGTHRVEVVISRNARTLEAFLASGDLEWDLRAMP